jgi:hypothetical protein
VPAHAWALQAGEELRDERPEDLRTCLRSTIAQSAIGKRCRWPKPLRDRIGEFARAYASGEPQALMGGFMARKQSRAGSQS